MDTDSQIKNQHFDASLPLPSQKNEQQANLAADLIRQKVAAAYSSEPDAVDEAIETTEYAQDQDSPHQQFIKQLTLSGKSVAEIQTAWHEYYAGLSDIQKRQVWQEFEQVHAAASRFPGVAETVAPAQPQLLPPEPHIPPINSKRSPINRSLADLKNYLTAGVGTRSKLRPKQHLQSLLFGLGIGSVVILILLFSFFNERFIAPFIQPSRLASNTPIINDGSAVNNNPEVIIPKINVEIPVIYSVQTTKESDIDIGLEQGVVHYPNTALPGQDGNIVIVGHSSNNILNRGKYKFAFVLLSKMENNDIFYLQKDSKRYTYKVYTKQIVKPTDVSVLGSKDQPATATLITCDPPGTSANRLVVVGQQISPDPSANAAAPNTDVLAQAKPAIIPGNSPSLWSRLSHWLSN